MCLFTELARRWRECEFGQKHNPGWGPRRLVPCPSALHSQFKKRQFYSRMPVK